MWIKRSELERLKKMRWNAEDKLRQYRARAKQGAYVSVWHKEYEKEILDVIELEDVCSYSCGGGLIEHNRYIFYDRYGRTIASICNVVDMFYTYSKEAECDCQERSCCEE